MKKIGLHGSYFGRNFGDTLILYIVKNWIKEHSKDNEIFLPFVTSAQEAEEILNSENKDYRIKELDGLIFGPGGYFGEQPGNFLKRLRWSIRNYQRHIGWNNKLFENKTPYMLVGVGVGPISFNFLRKKIVKLFENANYISVRDKYSKQYLIDWGIEADKINLAPDVALTLPPAHNNIKKQKPKVALHYPNNNLNNSGKVEDFVNFIKEINNNNEISLLEDSKNQYSNDSENNIKNILEKRNIKLPIIEYKEPSQLIDNLSEIDKIITSKLHVGIVGYALGKKVLSIPNHTKTIRFYEQIKREEFCIPLKAINTKILYEKFNKLDLLDSQNVLFEEATINKKIVFEFLNSL